MHPIHPSRFGYSARRTTVMVAALGILFAPLSAQPQPAATPLPWDLRALEAAPKWTVLERPKVEGIKALSFEGLPFRGRTTRVFAWLGLPDVPAGVKVPAMVLVHGGGGTAFEEWVRLWVNRGYAAIAMDTCGQIPVGHYGRWYRDSQGGPPGWGGFDQMDQPREDQWTYHAVADVILAHSLIRSLPEVDAERTGVTGISWGGYLTCIVAGVDHRFRLAVPVYGCGFYRDTVFADHLGQLGLEAADRWMTMWDPSVYLPNAAMPILWVNGSNDFAYTLGAMQPSYRLPPARARCASVCACRMPMAAPARTPKRSACLPTACSGVGHRWPDHGCGTRGRGGVGGLRLAGTGGQGGVEHHQGHRALAGSPMGVAPRGSGRREGQRPTARRRPGLLL
jgi:dienelactone hydrolase